jgi:hypothetical protein
MTISLISPGHFVSSIKQTTNLELLISSPRSACSAPKRGAYSRPYRHKRERFSLGCLLNTVTLLDMLVNISRLVNIMTFSRYGTI